MAKLRTDEENLSRLIKMLKMTTSDNDNMALVAIRKANACLDIFGGDWDSLLRGKVVVIADPFSGVPSFAPDLKAGAGPSTVPQRPAPKAPQPQPQPYTPRPKPKPAPQPSPAYTSVKPNRRPRASIDDLL